MLVKCLYWIAYDAYCVSFLTFQYPLAEREKADKLRELPAKLGDSIATLG